MAKNKKKVTTAIVAGVTAVALLLGGTFAWQSINQTALNEASDVINPGGRLHDDFDGKNKDVYVENFAEDPIFARVRLDEYFEIIMNKGSGAEKVEVITKGAKRDQLETYITHIFGDDNATDAFWTWQTGGQTVYMPTFNKDKDSLKADINGTYAGPDNNPDTENDAYGDYVPAPSVGETKKDNAKYDADTDNLDNGGTTDVLETHTATATLGATLMSMQEWMDAGSPVGEYWVYDEDGWVYWAAPIAPGTATGLLLDEIKLNQVMDDSWYYAINVVAQFVTADDLGRGTGTGFYDTNAGIAPSEKALELLEKIGVDTTSVVEDESALRDALLAGGNVQINGTIDSTSTENGGLNINYDYLWHNGGKVSGGTLNSTTGSYATLFINNEKNWPEDGDGANDAVLSGTKINTQSTFGIYIQNVDADTEVNNVTINGTKGGLRAEWGGTTTLNNVNIKVEGTSGTWFENSAVATSNGADIVINSGSYTGPYAVYVYSTGDNITINGGYFDGDLRVDAGSLVINGGTFTVDPSEFVDLSTYEVITNDDKTYTVKAIGGESGEVSELEEILWVYVTPTTMNQTVAAQFGQQIRVVLQGFEDNVDFDSENMQKDGLDAVYYDWDDYLIINYDGSSWRTEEVIQDRNVTIPLVNYEDEIKLNVIGRLSVLGSDVVINNTSSALALYDAEGNVYEDLSGAVITVSPSAAGTITAGSSVSGANLTFVPSENYTGSVDIVVTYDGINYRRSILVVSPEQKTAILLYHHDGMGWFLPGDTIYNDQWYSYYLLVDGAYQDVALPTDDTVNSNGWTYNDGYEGDGDATWWHGFTWDQQLSFCSFDEDGTIVYPMFLEVTYESNEINASGKYNATPTPDVTITGDTTELSISSKERYEFEVSEVYPKDSKLAAYLQYQISMGYEDWYEITYDCEFVINDDNSVTIFVDLSEWTYGTVDDAELVFECFDDYFRIDVSIVE